MKRVFVGDFRIGDEEKRAVNEVLDSGRISEWKKVREFERAFAEYIGVKYCVAVSSGTAALMVGLLALINDPRFPKVKKGSKVITTPLTYIATINAIVLCGMEPVFVDVSPEDFNLLPDQIEELLARSVDVDAYSMILPVHLMGYPCDMDKINRIAKKYGLAVLEDTAQAHGSLYKQKKVGSLSNLATYSFYIAHNIQAGEMGAVVTNDKKIATLSLQMKANGRSCDCFVCTRAEGKCQKLKEFEKHKGDLDPRFLHEYIGANFKTMEFQAALGLTQIKRADHIFRKRQENVKYLNGKLSKFSHILGLPLYSPDVSYLAYPLIINGNSQGLNRKYIRKALDASGIENRPLFGCIPTQQPAYAYLKKDYEGKLPNADHLGANAFYVGCHQYLKKEDLDHVVQAFEKIFE